jgi:hypothetical protein
LQDVVAVVLNVHYAVVPRETLPDFKLVPQPLSYEAEQRLKRPKGVWELIGERHRLGGDPEAMQEWDWPTCPSCSEEMSFYAQLDALPAGPDLADAGLIYVFICFDCFEVHAQLDSA